VFTLNSEISQNALSDQIGVDKATTAKAVKKLVEDKFIHKTKDQNDRRFYSIYPTERAAEIQPELKKIIKYHSRTLLKGFSDNETEQLSSFLGRLYGNLNEEIAQRSK